MNWWDIVKGKWKGRYVSKKWKKFAKGCIEEIEGIRVVDWKVTKNDHLVAKCEYTGDDLPPGKAVVNFNNTINLKKFGMSNRTCGGIKSRCRKELAKQKVYIGDW